ncbi:MAG: xylulokinase [Clostridia bacterium]|nr:xylulokinase [Clostridia bacterium]
MGAHMENIYIGIDLGTSGVKLLAVDEGRRVLAQTGRSYENDHPRAGWSEIDPDIWFRQTLDGLTELLSGLDPSGVAAIGVTGQMHTLVPLDGEGQCVRPALLWNDKRTKALIQELREALRPCSDGEYLSGIVSTGSPAANLLWLSREEPEAFARVRKFLIGPDYIVYRLTGTAGTNFCEASTSSLYAPEKRQWLAEILDLIGLPASACPLVRGSAEVAGCVLPRLCALLGLPEGTPVVAGTGDNPATALSTGCLGRGYPVLSLGTSGVLMFPVRSLAEVSRGKAILCSRDGRDFEYLVQCVVQATGESVSWWVSRVLGRSDYDGLAGAVTEEMRREPRLLFYPHLNGDKTLYADPNLRGAFLGLTSGHGPEQLYYAVLEGLCFAFRQLIETVRPAGNAWDALKVVGGGSGSDLWMQALADVLNIPVERMGGLMGPGFGSALLAWASDHSGQLLEAGLTLERRFEPDGSMRAFCDEKYRKYLRTHDALKAVDGERGSL